MQRRSRAARESEEPEQTAAADSRQGEEGCSPTPRIAIAHFALSVVVWPWSWIVSFLQLLTFLQIRQPGKFMRAMVFLTQGLCQTTANIQAAAAHAC